MNKYLLLVLFALVKLTDISGQLSEKYMIYCQDNLYGVAKRKGRPIILPKYDSIKFVIKDNDLFYVAQSKLWNIADTSGTHLFKNMQIGFKSEYIFYKNELSQFYIEETSNLNGKFSSVGLINYSKIQLGNHFYYKVENGVYLNQALDTAFISYQDDLYYDKKNDVLYINENGGASRYYLATDEKVFMASAQFMETSFGYFIFNRSQPDSTLIFDNNFNIVFSDSRSYVAHSEKYLRADYEPYQYYGYDKKLAFPKVGKDLEVIEVHKKGIYALLKNKKNEYALYDISKNKIHSFNIYEKRFIGNVYCEVRDSTIALYNLKDEMINIYASKSIICNEMIEIGDKKEKAILTLDGVEVLPYKKYNIKVHGYIYVVTKDKEIYKDMYDRYGVKKLIDIIDFGDYGDTLVAFSKDSLYITTRDLSRIMAMKLYGASSSIEIVGNDYIYIDQSGNRTIFEQIKLYKFDAQTFMGYYTKNGYFIISSKDQIITQDNYFAYNFTDYKYLALKYGYFLLKHKDNYLFRLVNLQGEIIYEGSSLRYLKNDVCTYSNLDGQLVYHNLKTNKILKTMSPKSYVNETTNGEFIQVYLQEFMVEKLFPEIKNNSQKSNILTEKSKNLNAAIETIGDDESLQDSNNKLVVGYVDYDLNFVIKPQYSHGTAFHDGYAFVIDYKKNSIRDGSIINKKGEAMGHFSSQEVVPLGNGFFKSRGVQGGPEEVFDYKGKLIIPSKGQHQSIVYTNGYFFLKHSNGTIILNEKGEQIFATLLKYNLTHAVGNFVFFNENNKTILYNVFLKRQKEFQTSFLDVFDDRYTLVDNNGKKYVFDLETFDYYR